jgi:hypothetical protein
MYCFRENSNYPFSNKKIITLVFYSWLGMGNGIPGIIISVLFMAGDGEWHTRYYY